MSLEHLHHFDWILEALVGSWLVPGGIAEKALRAWPKVLLLFTAVDW